MFANVERLASATYYKDSVRLLRENEAACQALGPPVRFKALNLRNPENVVTEEQANVVCLYKCSFVIQNLCTLKLCSVLRRKAKVICLCEMYVRDSETTFTILSTLLIFLTHFLTSIMKNESYMYNRFDLIIFHDSNSPTFHRF